MSLSATEISVETRARLIRQDWSKHDLSKYTDKELVSVWNDWFMTNQDDKPETYIEELVEAYPGR